VDDFSDRHVVPIAKLTVNADRASIPYGTAIDMGGCGKGYLADQLREPLDRPDIYGYRLSLGGDIATAGHDEHGEPWVLYIQDANNLSGEVDLAIHCPSTPFAVATSGTFRRKNQTKAKDWHHIIDPLTLRPATTDVRLATVCASSALEADVFASCAVLLGSQKAPKILKKQEVQAMLLQCADETGVFEEHFGSVIRKTPMQLPIEVGDNA
jgi:thiamine biosynthesis lipoprotein